MNTLGREPLDDAHRPNIMALCLVVSDKKIFYVLLILADVIQKTRGTWPPLAPGA